jgi:hypothetical protein
MSDQPLPEDNPDSLQSQLARYRAAIEQEYALAEKAASAASTENLQVATRDFFKDNSAHAAAQIAWLAMNAESESVRLRASQYIIERGLADSAGDGDPIKQLLSDLTSRPVDQQSKEPAKDD